MAIIKALRWEEVHGFKEQDRRPVGQCRLEKVVRQGWRGGCNGWNSGQRKPVL